VLRQSQYRVALAVTVLVLVGAVVFLATRLPPTFGVMGKVYLCEETNQSQTLSPDRRYIATVFVRDCGPKAGYVTHVNLRKATEVYLADGLGMVGTGQVVTLKGVALVTPRWAQNNELEVRFRGVSPLAASTVGSWNDVVIHSVDEGKAP
jgi:hypothetical protein